jgi:hypothetical protein
MVAARLRDAPSRTYNARYVTQRPTSPTWLFISAGAAILLGLLSLVPGWIDHHREMRGEGYRTLNLDLGAWQGGAVPVLAGGVVVLVVVGLTVAVSAAVRGDGRAPGVLALAGGIGLGLVAAAAWPIAHVGQVSSLWLSPGPVMVAGGALAVVIVAASLRLGRVRKRVVGVTVGLAAVALATGVGARTLILDAAEADRPHWSAGSYSREVAGNGRQVLTLGDGTFMLDDRWSGRFESRGLTMILVDDPACPDARGAYRIFDAGDENIRWELIVDVCSGGARIPDFVGVWQRDD